MMTELAPPLASIRPPSMQAVIEATRLRTLENVLRLIDPAASPTSPRRPRHRLRDEAVARASPFGSFATYQSRHETAVSAPSAGRILLRGGEQLLVQ